MQIHTERKDALRVYKEQSVALKQAKVWHKRDMEAAESFVGAVAPSRGVDAPSGIVIDADVAEGLGATWGLSPHSIRVIEWMFFPWNPRMMTRPNHPLEL